ncbi:MAG TPA: hypothetical protein VNF74_04010 [Terriglobales bacterium]|nr:hypothetical protein [Terriglobales bacterium]
MPTVKYATLGEPPQAQVYFSFEQQYAPAMILVRTIGDPAAALANLQAAVAGLDPSLPPLRTVSLRQRIAPPRPPGRSQPRPARRVTLPRQCL